MNEDLDERNAAAKALAEHLIESGAAMCVVPVIINDEKFEITVKRIPVSE